MYREMKSKTTKNEAASLKAVEQSMQVLHSAVQSHMGVMSSILGRVPEPDLSKSREIILKEAILEAIAVLEESRKAFKSKRLEMLRKKLTKVLIESGG